MSAKHLLAVVPSICDALLTIHAAGVVHADIKPANILLVQHDHKEERMSKDDLYPVTGAVTPCVFDFDIAYDQLGEPEFPENTIRGTPYYIAPETWDGEPPSPRSDLYALGVTLYEMLTGMLPFYDDTENASKGILEIMRMHQRSPIPDPRKLNPTVSKELAMVVGRALAKDPYNRYHDAKEFKEDVLLAVI